MLNTDELNSRILKNDERILLIFDNYTSLNLYRRNWGRDWRKLLFTDYDINHGRLVGLRYKAWYVVSPGDVHAMCVSKQDIYDLEFLNNITKKEE